jgi:hypothetical protein
LEEIPSQVSDFLYKNLHPYRLICGIGISATFFTVHLEGNPKKYFEQMEENPKKLFIRGKRILRNFLSDGRESSEDFYQMEE